MRSGVTRFSTPRAKTVTRASRLVVRLRFREPLAAICYLFLRHRAPRRENTSVSCSFLYVLKEFTVASLERRGSVRHDDRNHAQKTVAPVVSSPSSPSRRRLFFAASSPRFARNHRPAVIIGVFPIRDPYSLVADLPVDE